MQIIGAGFGRTGTSSLKAALEHLLDARCYHMIEIDPAGEHLSLWTAAARGQVVDWRAMFDSYEATVDFPSCLFVDQLADAFPEARIILTLRDPPTWYRSMCEMLSAGWESSQTDKPRDELDQMIVDIVFDGFFQGEFSDREATLARYEAHVERVVDTFDGDRLLQFDVGDGWKPLCEFLEVPVPAMPFPTHNSIGEVRERWGIVDEDGS